MRRTLMITAAICAVLCIGANAQAQKYFYHTTGVPQKWSNNSYWFNNTMGGGGGTTKAVAGEYAIIEADCYLDQNEACGHVDVSTQYFTAVNLYLDDTSTLVGKTLTVDSNGVTSTVDSGAIVHLRDDTSVLDFSNTSGGATHLLAGSGTVRGYDDSATISITSTNMTLTSETNIVGCLEISGDGSFTNSGTVDANDVIGSNETLTVKIGGTLSDSSYDRWFASTTDGAVLHFDSSIGTIGTLNGNFVITSGGSNTKIKIDHSLATNGRLEMSTGVLEIDPDDDGGGTDTVTFDNDHATTHTAAVITGGSIEVAIGETFDHK